MESMAALLACPICLEPFTDPRMLTTCFHTFCHKCLRDWIANSGRNGSFLCPVCKTSYRIQQQGAAGFPKNFFMNKCLDVVNEATNRAEPASVGGSGRTFEVCSNFDQTFCRQPEQFCLNCCEYYCNNCSSVHSRQNLSRDHDQVALESLTDEMLRDARLKSETLRCQEHNEKLRLYCNTCRRAVCSSCCDVNHQSHTFRAIKALDGDLKSELSNLMATVQGLIDADLSSSRQIKQSQQKVVNSTSAA